MIQSFQSAETQKLFLTGKSRKWSSLLKVAKRKLDLLHAAANLIDLAIPPSNHLELLKDDRAGSHSIRINDQYRICFLWMADGPHQVEIVDYH